MQEIQEKLMHSTERHMNIQKENEDHRKTNGTSRNMMKNIETQWQIQEEHGRTMKHIKRHTKVVGPGQV